MKKYSYQAGKPQKYLGIMFVIAAMLSTACKKDWLDAKPNASLVTPSTISDYQSILDDEGQFNINGPVYSEFAIDDFYIPTSSYSFINLYPTLTPAYIWQKDIPFTVSVQPNPDWDFQYTAILNTNIVLEGLSKIPVNAGNLTSWNNVKGSALFFRGNSFFNLAQEFTQPYNGQTAGTDYGIPLKLSSDVNQIVGRGTLAQTYSQILSDMRSSIPLLPATPMGGRYFRPSKLGAYAILSRVYLTMYDYSNALKYADSALKINSSLLDFNTLNGSVAYPMPYPNPEIDLDCASAYHVTKLTVDSNLFKSYGSNDLRKSLYFKSTGVFRGSYSDSFESSSRCETGPATDELYLIKAECEARLGDVTDAMNDLNTLLVKRWVKGTFTNLTATNAAGALTQILTERRKELVFRGTRWMDLRRLNTDPNYAVTLTRNYNGQVYTLAPNSPRYTFQIPPEEEQYNPIPQNP